MNNVTEIQAYTGDQLPAMEVINSGQAIQKAGDKYITAVAVQRSRSIRMVAEKVFDEAVAAGADFFYRWEIKTKTGKKVEVKGASIDLAMCFARNYMNALVGSECEEYPTRYVFTGFFVDLENGTTFKRQYRQRKRPNIGQKMSQDQERQEDITFQIGQSKAIRNVVLAMAPPWIISRAIQKAEEASIKTLKRKKEDSPEDFKAKVKALIAFFGEYGVTEDMLEFNLQKNLSEITAEDMTNLRATATALKEDRSSAREIFIAPYEALQAEETANAMQESEPEPAPEPPKDKTAKTITDKQWDRMLAHGEKLGLTEEQTLATIDYIAEIIKYPKNSIELYRECGTSQKAFQAAWESYESFIRAKEAISKDDSGQDNGGVADLNDDEMTDAQKEYLLQQGAELGLQLKDISDFISWFAMRIGVKENAYAVYKQLVNPEIFKEKYERFDQVTSKPSPLDEDVLF
jgi:hypothetical protein